MSESVEQKPAPSVAWCETALMDAARSLDRITAIKRLTPPQRLKAVMAVQTYVAARWAAYKAAHAGTAPVVLPTGWMATRPELAAANATLNALCISPAALPWWNPEGAA